MSLAVGRIEPRQGYGDGERGGVAWRRRYLQKEGLVCFTCPCTVSDGPEGCAACALPGRWDFSSDLFAR